jgi:hypothetical protein
LALVADGTHPSVLDRPMLGPGLAADDHPVDASKVQAGQWAKERLEAEEALLDCQMGTCPTPDRPLFCSVPRLGPGVQPETSRQMAPPQNSSSGIWSMLAADGLGSKWLKESTWVARCR